MKFVHKATGLIHEPAVKAVEEQYKRNPAFEPVTEKAPAARKRTTKAKSE